MNEHSLYLVTAICLSAITLLLLKRGNIFRDIGRFLNRHNKHRSDIQYLIECLDEHGIRTTKKLDRLSYQIQDLKNIINQTLKK